MADPFATIRRVYERLGLELSAESEARMRDFLAATRPTCTEPTATRSPTPASTPASCASARRYQEYFDVPPSLAGPAAGAGAATATGPTRR